MVLPKPQSNPERGGETERVRRARLLAEFDALREQIHQRHLDLTPEEWAALADEWSDAVADGLRKRMRRLDQQPNAHYPSCR